jgi:hypothetical protein
MGCASFGSLTAVLLACVENPSMKPSISSYSLVRRILHIFDRATKKFKGDVGLWIQYAEIAKKQNARPSS